MKQLALIALVLFSSAVVQAQSKPETLPIMKIEHQLQIRNLQYEQDKRLLEMKRIEAQYKELQESVRAYQQQLEEAVRSGAAAAKVDLKKFQFNLDTLSFVPRSEHPPSTKPLEVPK